MKKIIKWLVLLSIFATLSLYIAYRFNNIEKGEEYERGKTPGCYFVTFSGDQLIYKDDVLFDGNYENRGLYIKSIYTDYESEDDLLLSNDFYMCVNIYKDWVYFLDTENNLQKVKFDGSIEECVIRGESGYISDVLILNDILYFIRSNEFEKSSLYAMELYNNEIKEVVEDIDFKYLYDYCGSACVISRDNEKVIMYNHQSGHKQVYDNLDTEIQGFLLNGAIIHYSRDKIIIRDSFETENDEVIVELENIYRIIVHHDDMVIATANQYGVIQIYEYSFKKDKLKRIAIANYPPRDYNDKFIVCFSDTGHGNVELIDRKSGEIKIFSFK